MNINEACLIIKTGLYPSCITPPLPWGVRHIALLHGLGLPVKAKTDFVYEIKEVCKTTCTPRKNILIGDSKTAFDRYLTHFLARTLDRQSSKLFSCCAGQPANIERAKGATHARTRDENTHRPHMTRTDAVRTEKKTQARDAKQNPPTVVVWGRLRPQ